MADKSDLSSALQRATDRRTRRAGLRAAVFLVVALVAAVGSALLLTRYIEARASAARVPTESVVVAAAELPVGLELQAEHLRVVRWPAASRPDGAFGDPAELVGKVVGSRIYPLEPILPARLSGGPGGGLSSLLPPGMRAVAVRVDDVVGVAGFIHPGDSVDVIVTLRPDGGRAATSSKVILQNIRVLAVGGETDGEARSTALPGRKRQGAAAAAVATLQVNADQSERLALAAAQGKLLLTLRSAADADEVLVATKGMTPDTLLGLAPKPPPGPSPAPAPKATKIARVEPEKKGEVIEILRGDLFERRNFDPGAKR
jgi:pilus assembly protein CpaB